MNQTAEFAAQFSAKPAADEAQRKRWIESVKLTGNAGIGVMVLNQTTQIGTLILATEGTEKGINRLLL